MQCKICHVPVLDSVGDESKLYVSLFFFFNFLCSNRRRKPSLSKSFLQTVACNLQKTACLIYKYLFEHNVHAG